MGLALPLSYLLPLSHLLLLTSLPLPLFLPLHADFMVPSSREAVDSNNPWNEQLRQHLPRLYVQALEVRLVGEGGATVRGAASGVFWGPTTLQLSAAPPPL